MITAWSTGVVLENLEVIPEAFDYLQLPVKLRKGFVGRLEIKVKKPVNQWSFLLDVWADSHDEDVRSFHGALCGAAHWPSSWKLSLSALVHESCQIGKLHLLVSACRLPSRPSWLLGSCMGSPASWLPTNQAASRMLGDRVKHSPLTSRAPCWTAFS